MIKVLIVYVFTFLSLFSIGQTEKLSSYFNFLNNAGFSGQILVATKGRVVGNQASGYSNKAFGYSNKEKKIRNSSRTIFNIGSLTKQFTATAILWLEQAGKLKTTDTLGMFWDTIPVEKKGISILQLLSHSSGLARQTFQTNEIVSKKQLLDEIFSRKLVSKPGSTFQYSNSGYEILAAIIEKVSGTSYKEFIRETFIIPYHLTNTCFNTDDLSGSNKQVALGYNEWKEVSKSLVVGDNWNNTGAGNILSTTEDLYRWFENLNSCKILNESQKNKLFSTSIKAYDDEDYGFGWFHTLTGSGKKLMYHSGDLKGYHSEFRYYSDDDIIIVILMNQEMFNYGISRNYIASNISKILSGNTISFPTNTKQLKSEDASKFCGIYKLDSLNIFKIWMNAGQLTIGASGQKAIDLFVPKKARMESNLTHNSEKSLFLINSVINGQDESAKQGLSPKSAEVFLPALKEYYTSCLNTLGNTSSVSLLGSIPAYWSDTDRARTYVKLNFKGSTNTFYFGWDKEDLYDFTVNDDRPFPLIYPLIFKSDKKAIIYNLDNNNSAEIEFNSDKNLIIKNICVSNEDGTKKVFINTK